MWAINYSEEVGFSGLTREFTNWHCQNCQTKRNVNVLLFAISPHSVHVLPFAQQYLLFHQLALQTNHCLTEYTKASISEEIRHRSHVPHIPTPYTISHLACVLHLYTTQEISPKGHILWGSNSTDPIIWSWFFIFFYFFSAEAQVGASQRFVPFDNGRRQNLNNSLNMHNSTLSQTIIIIIRT